MNARRYPALVKQMPMSAAFDARGSEAALRAGLAAAGLALPDAANRFALSPSGLHLLRLGPRRVLVLAPPAEERRLEAALLTGFESMPSADCANISDMHVGFEVSGKGALEILKQGAPLDLSPGVFPVGAATGTEIWSIAVILIRESEGRYLVLVDRALAGYLADWLAAANGEDSGLKPGTMLSPPAPLKSS